MRQKKKKQILELENLKSIGYVAQFVLSGRSSSKVTGVFHVEPDVVVNEEQEIFLAWFVKSLPTPLSWNRPWPFHSASSFREVWFCPRRCCLFVLKDESTLALITSVPQGCVPSPLVYALITHGHQRTHNSNSVVKVGDDKSQSVIRLLSDNDEAACSKFRTWWYGAAKTMEIIVDFRTIKKLTHSPGCRRKSPVSGSLESPPQRQTAPLQCWIRHNKAFVFWGGKREPTSHKSCLSAFTDAPQRAS